MSNAKLKIIAQVEKLLALSASTTHTAEAETAANKAAELMAKHNISRTESTQAEFTTHTEQNKRKTPIKYNTVLFNILARYCGVYLLVRTRANQGFSYIYCGRDEDVEAFLFLKDSILTQRKMAWTKHLKQHKMDWGCPPSHKSMVAWNFGYAMGVSSTLDDLKRREENKVQEWGLVPIDDIQAAENFYKENINKNVSKSKGRKFYYDGQGYKAGTEAKIQQGITREQPKKNLKLSA